jgi:hypothetical protein
MPTWAWILIIVGAAVLVLAVVWSAMRTRRTRTLQEGFGPEYDRTVQTTGDRREAERELAERQKQREELDIRPLSPQARDRYVQQWQTTQARFVDDPGGAVREADGLVQQVMAERGYPTDDWERREADISVDHPDLVENYRAAHRISQSNDAGQASTEELRQSIVHYRALFEELLETGDRETAEARR